MLLRLTIRALAVIDHLEFDCSAGLIALTGETGAGKSIVVDALGLLLGARADTDMIRAGNERAEVCGIFATSTNSPAQAWLTERRLEDGSGECIVRRVLDFGGRSRAFVNERPMPAHMLRELGECLVDIHGQHTHHLLPSRDRQRLILDDFGGHHELIARVAEAAGRWGVLRNELDGLVSDGEDRASRLDFLRFQLHELEGLRLGVDEPERLSTEQRRLAHAESVLDGCRRTLERLDGDDGHSTSNVLDAARRNLEAVARHEPRAGEVMELVEAAAINVTEAECLAPCPDRVARPRPRATLRGGASPRSHSRPRPQAPCHPAGAARADRATARACRLARFGRAACHGD